MSDETKRQSQQRRSPLLLSPNMELERAKAKVRLLQKEVSHSKRYIKKKLSVGEGVEYRPVVCQ